MDDEVAPPPPTGAAQPAAGLFFAAALLPEGWVEDVRLTIERGLIATIEPGAAPRPGDERAEVGLPGLPNLHSHGFQRGFAGLTEHRGGGGDGFWSWRERMYRFLADLTPDDLEAITAQAYVEMLESGFTRAGEFHYLHHGPNGVPYADPAELSARVVAAAADTGIGLCLLPVFYAHGGFGGAAVSDGQRRFVLDLDEYARLLESAAALVAPLPNGRVGVAPHSLRAVAPAQLRALLPLAAARPIHIHVAEQAREVEQCLAWSGRRPVEWLLDELPVDARWCLVHATHVSPPELERAAVSGAVVGLCPISEANLGDGVFPAAALLAAGGRFGIGSDSNVRIRAAEELRLLEYGQRLERRARNVLSGADPAGGSTGRTLYATALAGGAQALGVPAGIARGAPADLVTLDPAEPCLIARAGDQLLDSWVFAGGGAIDRVWASGVEVVRAGRHRRREAIAARFRAVLARILRR